MKVCKNKLWKNGLVVACLSILSSYAFAVWYPAPKEIVQVDDVALSWAFPEFREDGSNLSIDEIAGFRIGYGLISDNEPAIIIEVGKATESLISNLSPGVYSFAVMAIDTNGNESVWSQTKEVEVVRVFRPSSPSSLNADVNSDIASTVGAVGSCMASERCVAKINLQWSENSNES